MARKFPRHAPPRALRQAKAAGKKYAQDQLQSDYFMDWVRDQLIEASRMDPNDVLPLETKADAEQIAHNMLQQLEWDTKHAGAAQEQLGNSAQREDIAAFYDGFRKALDEANEWLADELLRLNSEMSPKKHRVRDYIAVDRRDRPVGPRHKGYSDAKREADAAGGVVKFVPSARETRRPKAVRSARRR